MANPLPSLEDVSSYLPSFEDVSSYFEESKEERKVLFRLVNDIRQNPDDTDALKEYVELALPTVEDTEPSEVLEACDQVEAFLMERAGEVSPENLDEVLQIADSLDEKREAALRKAESPTEEPEADKEVIQKLNQWREDGLDQSIPENQDDIQKKLRLCRNVRSLISSREDAPLEGLEPLINRLQAVSETDELLAEAASMLDTVENMENATEAAYVLQSVEQGVRQLVMKQFEVPDGRSEQIESLTRRLERTSDAISKRQRRAEDQRLWNDFLEEHEKALSEALGWSQDDRSDVFKTVKKKFGFENGSQEDGVWLGKEPNGFYTERLEKIEDLLDRINRMAAQLQGESILEEVQCKMNQLEDQYEDIQKCRSQAYNEFALSRLKKTFSFGQEKSGMMTNRKAIASAMATLMGEIDRRLLTAEVERCYSEVFENLYEKLKKAKGEDDFEEEGRKLNVLKRMYEQETVQPVAF